MKSISIYIFATLATIYISSLFIMAICQEKIILHPKKLSADYQFSFNADFEEGTAKMPDGTKLSTLYFKTDQPKKGLIFYIHGNANNIQRFGRHATEFTKLGYDVFFYDYRGFGKSEGKTKISNIVEDADYLLDSIFKTNQNLVLFGRSLGTGIATQLASKYPVQKLILETPYYSLTDVGKRFLPFFPVEKVLTFELPSFKYAPLVACPTLIIHGTADELVPYKSGLKLSKLFKDNTFISIPDGKHRGLGKTAIYQKALDQFLQ